MNTNQLGNIGLGKAIAYFTGRGHSVSVPLTDSQKYDLIVDIDGLLKRVQVKYTSRLSKNNKYFLVGLRTVTVKSKVKTISRNYVPGDFDLLFVVTPQGDFVVDSEDITTTNTYQLKR